MAHPDPVAEPPRLRAGTPVLQRGPGAVQVGLLPGRAVVLHGRARTLLRHLDGATPRSRLVERGADAGLEAAAVAQVLERLAAADLLEPAAAPPVPAGPAGGHRAAGPAAGRAAAGGRRRRPPGRRR